MRVSLSVALLFSVLFGASAFLRSTKNDGADKQAEEARVAEGEVMDSDDTSDQGLWKHAWAMTLAKYGAQDALMNPALKQSLYPEAQHLWQTFLQARHRLREKAKASAAAREVARSSSQEDQDKEELDQLKQSMAEKLTANLKNVKDDDDVPAVTTTTTTEDPQAMHDREALVAMKAEMGSKLTEGMDAVSETPDAPAVTVSTTTESPQQKADREALAALKDKMASKLTEGMDAPEPSTTATTTTTTTTMDPERQRRISEIQQGHFGKIFANFMPKEAPKPVAFAQAPVVEKEVSSTDDSEAAQDFDTYDSMGF